MLHNSVDHYENFPVASILLPRRMRHAVGLIYRFARRADDFADEGDLAPAQRLALLQDFRSELDRIGTRVKPRTPLFIELAREIERHDLPLAAFYDLLDAFSQDVNKTRYANFAEVMHYCRRSANPVGRLLLHLHGAAEARNLALSDAICSSLQLINFLQDVAIDYAKGRVYLPLDELAKYHIDEQQIASGHSGGAWQPFMLFQIERTRRLLNSGAPLAKSIGGRFGLELRMIVMGGETILRKLHKSRGDVFRDRPVLKPFDWPFIVARALSY